MAVKASNPTATGHTAGIFADMTLDGPEIGTLVVVVDRAKNLPNRKTIGKQDPYCAMRLGKEAKKTDTDRRGGQTPKWDQELRFTVHESPDYYKLKVSIFNDDKRTDMIGEAFISLADLIKPGGGSNDLWHQLNYKGKYAGEIRIEMTYYDMRPRDERATEKRRYKTKGTVASADQDITSSDAAAPRKLGPRDVRRRPLPNSPGEATPHASTSSQAASQTFTVAATHAEPNYPQGSQHGTEPLSEDLGYHHPKLHHQLPPRPNYATHFNQYQEEEHSLPPVVSTPQFVPETTLRRPLPAIVQNPQPHEEYEWDYHSRRQSYNHNMEITNSRAPRSSSGNAPLYSSTQQSPSDENVTQNDERHVRQSLPHRVNEPVVQDTWYPEEAPPPPPKHHATSRNRPSSIPSASLVPQPLKPIPIRPFVSERSPLQTIERDFELQYQNNAYAANIAEQDEQTPVITDPRRYVHAPLPQTPRHVIPSAAEQTYPDEPRSLPGTESNPGLHANDDGRFLSWKPNNPRPVYGEGKQRQLEGHTLVNSDPPRQLPTLPPRPRSYDDQIPHVSTEYRTNEPYSSSPYSSSAPMLVQNDDQHVPRQARPTNRSSLITPIRKAISPGPYPEEAGGRRLSSIPFGPDAYDVLNPASSPVSNENTPFETPEQARRSSHLRESAREFDPIIDNDGRVIDPSDHLPTSSWAPEPERKQRKPEHVIHYRTKNDSRSSGSAASTPASLRTHVRRNMPSSPMTNSPASAPSSAGKMAAQIGVQIANHPQHYPPDRQTRPIDQSHHSRMSARYSYHEGPQALQRPSLSEYQVPVHNNQGIHDSSSNSYYHISSSNSILPSCHTMGHHDSLAAELSMIDIGPGRSPRTSLRPTRGY